MAFIKKFNAAYQLMDEKKLAISWPEVLYYKLVQTLIFSQYKFFSQSNIFFMLL